MATKRNTFKLGLSVLVMFLLLFGCLLFIGGGDLFAGRKSLILVRFPPGGSMPEITKGSFVTYFGQKVGVVKSTRLVVDSESDKHFLEVRAALNQDLGLREDCRIVASGPPLGGMGEVAILSRGSSAGPVSADRPIYGQPAGFQAALDMITRELDVANPEGLIARIKLQLHPEDRQSLVARINLSLADLNVMTTRLATELDRRQDVAFLHKLHAGLDQLNRGLVVLTSMLETNRPRVDSSLASIDSAAGKLDTGVMSALVREFELTEDQDHTLLTKAHDAFNCLNQSLADLNVTTDHTKGVIVLNKDRISELVENATDASVHLRQGVKDLSLHPWKLLAEPSTAEKREMHIFNVAREFTEAAGHLDDSTSRLRSLLEAENYKIGPDDPELRQIREELAATVDQFSKAEQALWDELHVAH